jgi:hypothetical protein
MEKDDDINPLLDTGEAARRAYAELQVLTSLTAEQIRRMEAWSKKYDAEHAAEVKRRGLWIKVFAATKKALAGLAADLKDIRIE